MSYRNIEVDGTKYQYSIGKTHTKVRGLGVWPNRHVGKSRKYDPICECCGFKTSLSHGYWAMPEKLMVKPSDVFEKIKKETK